VVSFASPFLCDEVAGTKRATFDSAYLSFAVVTDSQRSSEKFDTTETMK